MKHIERLTKETKIRASLELYGGGSAKVRTGVGFFDHMLEVLCKHALWDLELVCEGDLQVDSHHSVEDVGIVLGGLLRESLYPVQGIERYGNAAVVMDEACVECDLDISNRPFLVCELEVAGMIGGFDAELAEEFFRALAFNAGISLHIIQKRGKNRHHIIEAAFKALAVALRRACSKNERMGMPSTKGVL